MNKRLMPIIAIGVFLVLWSAGIVQFQKKQHFNGIVQNIRVGFDNVPIVTINNVDHYLFGSFDLSQKIKKGDILIKPQNSSHYFLIKANTKDTIDLYHK
jgi:hypothetical protein